MTRKILIGTLIVLSSTFLILSMLGIALAWIYNEPETRGATSPLQEVDSQLTHIPTALRTLPEPEKKPFDPKTAVLAHFTGRYYSDELETRYTFDIRNDTLTSHHQRHNDFKLAATATDTFTMEFLGTLVFTRDAKGKVNGFKASNGRVRNLVFRKE